jgi:hypothetical protein
MMTGMGEDKREDNRAFLVELAIAGCVVFALAIAIGVVTGAESGSIADWLAGLSTFAAFIAAVVAARYASQAVARERHRDEARESERRSADASQVAAWFADEYQFTTGNPIRGVASGAVFVQKPAVGGVMPVELRLTVSNLSRFPVTAFRVHIFLRGGNRPDGKLSTVSTYALGRVFPGDWDYRFDSPWVCNAMYDLTDGMSDDQIQGLHLAIGWSFVDNAGEGWLRHPDTRLAPVPRSELPKPRDWGGHTLTASVQHGISRTKP